MFVAKSSSFVYKFKKLLRAQNKLSNPFHIMQRRYWMPKKWNLSHFRSLILVLNIMYNTAPIAFITRSQANWPKSSCTNLSQNSIFWGVFSWILVLLDFVNILWFCSRAEKARAHVRFCRVSQDAEYRSFEAIHCMYSRTFLSFQPLSVFWEQFFRFEMIGTAERFPITYFNIRVNCSCYLVTLRS